MRKIQEKRQVVQNEVYFAGYVSGQISLKRSKYRIFNKFFVTSTYTHGKKKEKKFFIVFSCVYMAGGGMF